jgi:hypothetical protein
MPGATSLRAPNVEKAPDPSSRSGAFPAPMMDGRRYMVAAPEVTAPPSSSNPEHKQDASKHTPDPSPFR